MRDDLNCSTLQQLLREGRELTNTQAAHIDGCEACIDAWLTAALEEKPKLLIPDDFADRVRARLPERSSQGAIARRPRHWGFISAMAIVTVLLVVFFTDPASPKLPANSWLAPVFLFLLTVEIAGLALWLGPRWLGR